MSSSEEDERRESVRREPNLGTGGGTTQVLVRDSSDGSFRQVIAEPAPSVERESVVKHKTTNTSALVGMAVGIVVLALGLFLVIRDTPFLPYPLSIFAVLIVGVGLIGIGASLVSSRSEMK